MLFPDHTHLFDGDVLRLRQEEVNEERHDNHKSRKVDEQPELQLAQHLQEHLGDNEGEDHVDCDIDALGSRPDFQGEDLARHQPPQRAPRPSESGHVHADEGHHQYGKPLGQISRVSAASKFQPNAECDCSLGYKHLNTTLKKQPPSPQLINFPNGKQSGQNVNPASNHRREKGSIASEPDGLEEDGRVEHDDINPGELLEEGNQDRHHKLRPVLPLQQLPPGVLHSLGSFAGGDQVLELPVDVVDSPYPLEPGFGFFVLSSGKHRVGSVGKEEGADGDDQGGNHGATQTQTPSP
ncbi:unnamed protein product [Cuscuta europaea]|uniref:Uncharacterized protein n=1 Tax=Cuscuta europaea TaxID=41803 RepID=A0A9P0ZSS8_CUSEU|nr:unnamed protein product [Cuscuta europaea]